MGQMWGWVCAVEGVGQMWRTDVGVGVCLTDVRDKCRRWGI